MLKFSGKNFQPWQDFSLELSGLTVITGPSNQGKSSVFRALKGILRNDLPASFVRENHDPMELTVEIDGHTIKSVRQRKGKGSTTYTVDEGTPDEKVYSSLNGKLPDILTDMKFGEIHIGDTVIDPIFSVQNEAQFLIDPKTYKPGDINAVLGAFAHTEKLDKGKKEANLRITQKNSEAKTLAGEVRDAEERKAKLAELVPEGDSIAEKIAELEKEIIIREKKAAWTSLAAQHYQHVTPLREIEKALVLPDLSTAANTAQRVEHTLTAIEAKADVRQLTKLNDVLQVSVGVDIKGATALQSKVANLGVALEAKSHTQSLQKFRDGMREAVSVDIQGATALQGKVGYLGSALEAMTSVAKLQKLDYAISNTAEVWSEIVRLYKTSKALDAQAELLVHNDSTLTKMKDGLDSAIGKVGVENRNAEQASSSIKLLEAAILTKGLVKQQGVELSGIEQELADTETIVNDLKKTCPICGKKIEVHVCQS